MSRPSSRRLAAGAAVAALAAALVAGYAFASPERYEADAAIEVTPVPADDETFAGFSVLRVGQDPVETAAQLVETAPVAEAVAVRLRLDSADEARDRVEADADARGRIVRVRGRASDGAEAAQVANAFADEVIRQRSSLFQTELQRTLESLRTELANVPVTRRDEPPAVEAVRRLAELRAYEGRGDPTLRIAGTATAPADPKATSGALALALGLPLALALGALVAFLPLAVPAASVRRRDETQKPDFARRERRLADRLKAVTARERELARRAAELSTRERSLERREAVAVTAEPAPVPVPEPEPERAAAPEPEPSRPAGRFNLGRLEQAVETRAEALAPHRRDELHAYLVYLRTYAAADGTLPRSFDALVADVFADVLS